MRVTPTALPEVLLIEARHTADARGGLVEAWHAERYAAAGIGPVFVQDNFSPSGAGVLRGLHFQHPGAQGKLVSALAGAIFDVAVDIRRGSPRFGRWVGVSLSEHNHRQLWIPPGFAHGFCGVGRAAAVTYKLTAPYDAPRERTLAWDDPTLAIDWPVRQPVLSDRDRAGPLLADAPALPVYKEGV